MINANQIVGTHHILFMTLDTLRYDVARRAMEEGATPVLKALIPAGWERRHTPGSFTYAAHHAFFAGFLPTPARPGPHPRLFASSFPGSITTTERTYAFDAPDIISGFTGLGYHTICIGGVNFFDKASPLGKVLPAFFAESHWHPSLGVEAPDSTRHQAALAVERLGTLPPEQKVFLFVNISAIHYPNRIFLPGAADDSPETMQAALAYVDRQLPPLFTALGRRGPALCILCSDHGTCYGEEGYQGHRLSHPVVMDVPYAEFILPDFYRS
jgi:hypothetical protein